MPGTPISIEQAGSLTYDPLRQTAELPLGGTFYPFGFPVAVETNSPELLEAAHESWDSFSPVFDEPPILVRAAVAGDGSRERPPVPVFRGQGHLLVIVSDSGNFAVCDSKSRFAFCWLTPGAVADLEWLRFHFLEAMVYSLQSQLYLTAVHAACVAHRGHAVLLFGESGSGKSCLAFACASRGWTYLSDDATALIRSGDGRTVLGNPCRMRFRDTATVLLPELGGRLARHDVRGKTSIEINTADLGGIETAFQSRAGFLVFLNRLSATSARLVPVSRDEAFSRILHGVPLFDEQTRRRQHAFIRKLSGVKAWELRYDELDAAVEALRQLVEQGG